MTKEWDQAALQQYIDDEIEETLTLEYKAAGAFKKADKERSEITKDVSAMANSAGGTIVYGIREYNEPGKKHLPERITPIDRKQLSKEWLEQIINSIRPRISDLVFHSVSLSSGPNDVAYVVEVPHSSTAHQATDKKYYKRFNFLAEAMDDYEIRDILNRQSTPDASVEFGFDRQRNTHDYLLKVFVTNHGTQVIQNFLLEFTFPHIVGFESNEIFKWTNMELRSEGADYVIIYRSEMVLFPNERREIGHEMNCRYKMDGDKYAQLEGDLKFEGNEIIREGTFVQWTLYADNMTPKKGSLPYSKNFHEF